MYYFPESWPLPKGVKAAFTLRGGGSSSAPYFSNNLGLHVDDDASAVLRNREKLTKVLRVPQVQWLNQVHGTQVHNAQLASVNDIPDADAVFTSEAQLACAVLTADCLPVLFAADDGSLIAAAHAGWRGLAAGVLLETLKHFPEPNKVCVYLGPAIGPQAFEVGPEVKAAFPWASPKCFTAGNGDRLLANLYLLAQEQLQAAGVQQVYSEQRCTVNEADSFFSYRRDGVTGRMASLIWRS